MWIQGKSDVKDVIVKHLESIDKEIGQTYSSEKEIRAELLAAKSEALKALAELYK